MRRLIEWLRSKGAQIDPLLEEKIEEWKRYKEQKEFEAKLEKVKVQDMISDELRKVLEEQSQRENEEIMREMVKFGGEPVGSWLFYVDAQGFHEKGNVID